jgi:hypothetical protein
MRNGGRAPRWRRTRSGDNLGANYHEYFMTNEPRRHRWIVPVIGTAMLLAAACGGDDDDGPMEPPASDTTLTASIDGGTTFSAASLAITSANGRLLIIASRGNNESMGLGFELRTGTQSSGTGGTATASYVMIGQGAWAAGPNLAASSGTLTLTTATANRVVGTFSFSLVASSGTPATRQLTNGQIDIRY